MKELVEEGSVHVVGHITVWMLIAFSLSVMLVFIYGIKLKKENKGNKGYALANYLTPSWQNILFHIIGGLIFLLLTHELGDWLIEKFFAGQLNTEDNEYVITLSVISGLFGASIIARVLEWFRKSKNIADVNIEHIHGENCKH